MTREELISNIASLITTGGNQTSAAKIRTALGNLVESTYNPDSDGAPLNVNYFDLVSMLFRDEVPASPNAANDEFLGDSLSDSWTLFQNSSQVLTVEKSFLNMTNTGQSTNLVRGIFKTLPAGNLTIICKVHIPMHGGGDGKVGLCLFEDAASNQNTTPLGYLGIYLGSSPKLIVETATNYSGTFTERVSYAPATTPSPLYLKITRTGSAYTWFFSTDGVVWQQMPAYATLPFTAGQFGLIVNNAGSASKRGLFDWVRIYATDPGILGEVHEFLTMPAE